MKKLMEFMPVLREIVEDINPDVRLAMRAAKVLQDASEDYLAELFEESATSAILEERVALLPKDLHLARRMRGERF